nr:DUF2085 domain-containing protein [Anaerobranca gottschalkii]
MFFCHRLPDRSFYFRGKKFPMCARCTGILVGYFLGVILLFFYPINLYFSLILLLPLSLDGGMQYLGFYTSTNPRRFITGILAGIGTIFLLREALVLGRYHGEIFWSIFKN